MGLSSVALQHAQAIRRCQNAVEGRPFARHDIAVVSDTESTLAITACPVCGTTPRLAKVRDYGERLTIDCPRCGEFEITDTTADMLASRAVTSPMLRARLSHQIRVRVASGIRAPITPENLDEHLAKPLPKPADQIRLFLREIGQRVGEDRFGDAALSRDDFLSIIAAVGAKDEDSATNIVDQATRLGLVDSSRSGIGEPVFSLTAAGWERLEEPGPGRSPGSVAQGHGLRPRPGWIRDLEDDALRNLLNEVYGGIDAGLLALPLMGARAAFDRAMSLLVGDPPGGFRAKLGAMNAQGRLNERGVMNLQPMIDAGSAAAHRGWLPTAEVLSSVMNEVEHCLWDWFVRDAAASSVGRAAPPRRP